MTADLPTFVVLPDGRGFAPNGPGNWTAGFLPATHQGTMIRPASANPIADLFPPASAKFIDSKSETAGLAVLGELNRAHEAARPGDSQLEARIRSYELAARLQTSAPEVLDLANENARTLEEYGLNDPVTEDFGRYCLVARRLLERGVRFVQVWSGADNGFPRRNWDSHEDLRRDHGPLARGMARGASALIQDLKQRGMLDDTIVFWTTEFGRMPSSQGSKGRDHNPHCFTNWLAGGGIKGGVSYGPSDKWGFKPAEGGAGTEVYDVHATILRLLGIDHEKLTFRFNGVNRRLTDVHGDVIQDLLA
jgi:hypothetical protein